MDPTTVDSKMLSPVTEDGSMDRRGNPAARAKTGRWKTAILLLGKFHVFTLITLLTFRAVCVKLRNEIFMTQYDTNGILFWSSTKFWPLFVPLNLYFLNLIKTAFLSSVDMV
jgi:solute carrier family 15 (peptide/histidine transporter), member 3/4